MAIALKSMLPPSRGTAYATVVATSCSVIVVPGCAMKATTSSGTVMVCDQIAGSAVGEPCLVRLAHVAGGLARGVGTVDVWADLLAERCLRLSGEIAPRPHGITGVSLAVPLVPVSQRRIGLLRRKV